MAMVGAALAEAVVGFVIAGTITTWVRRRISRTSVTAEGQSLD